MASAGTEMDHCRTPHTVINKVFKVDEKQQNDGIMKKQFST